MSLNDVELLRQVKDQSNIKFHSNNQSFTNTRTSNIFFEFPRFSNTRSKIDDEETDDDFDADTVTETPRIILLMNM